MIKLSPGWQLKTYESVGSTMDEARQHLEDKTIIWSKAQTAGRGRHQRPWLSEPGNLFCSFIVRPSVPLRRWSELTFMSTLAVGQTLAAILGEKATLIHYKWPNDVLMGQKKICGILLEITEPFIVVGIGINVASCPDPTKVRYPTCCLREICVSPPTVEDLLSKLSTSFQLKYEEWESGGFSSLCQDWLKRAAQLGQEVTLNLSVPAGFQTIKGIFQGINEQGSLLLKLPNGTIQTYHTGEITMR